MQSELMVINDEQSRYIRKLLSENKNLAEKNEKLYNETVLLKKILTIAVGKSTIIVTSDALAGECAAFVFARNMSGDLLLRTGK